MRLTTKNLQKKTKIKMINDTSKEFIRRHIGPSEEDIEKMLKIVGANSLDDLISKTVPETFY